MQTCTTCPADKMQYHKCVQSNLILTLHANDLRQLRDHFLLSTLLLLSAHVLVKGQDIWQQKYKNALRQGHTWKKKTG